MRSSAPRYPVDRYLVESSKKTEMVNITDEDIWNPEPALKPEEEIMLRKLHDMLQSTADDLKLLSGELSRHRAPATRVKSSPTPLDQEFNEKVHIEEVVNAKFHGHKIVDKTSITQKGLQTESNLNKLNKVNTGIQVNTIPILKKPIVDKKLAVSKTNIVHINEINQHSTKTNKINNNKKIYNQPTIAYNEFSHKYTNPEVENSGKGLQLQVMPSINIRSELKKQKVLQLDISPEIISCVNDTNPIKNVAVISMQHEIAPVEQPKHSAELPQKNMPNAIMRTTLSTNKQARKVSKMSTCESSESTNNVSSDPQNIKVPPLKNIKTSPHASVSLKKKSVTGNNPPKRPNVVLDEWKKKLNTVYGQPSSSRIKTKSSKSRNNLKKVSPKKTNINQNTVKKPQNKVLNNAQYIPYSQLTLGGVNVSDIEKEISNIPNKSNLPLSPILDRIISSRENSRHSTPRKSKPSVYNSPRILTTSDENLLQEVIDIENTVSKTLSKNTDLKLKLSITSSESEEVPNDSYIDDFEDDGSVKSDKEIIIKLENQSAGNKSSNDSDNINSSVLQDSPVKSGVLNKTYSKVQSLSFKGKVDVFEFIHSVDKQDTATQSNGTNKISLKETQTSPRNTAHESVQPIHNDLWPSVDPTGDVERMFKLEKDLIKKLIIDEYGDLLERTINKPSTSKGSDDISSKGLNIATLQKITQTSPKHVKSIMTSPTITKTRTTSPFALSPRVDHQTSPMIFVTNEKEVTVEIENDAEDRVVSLNLSSPRFSLRMPNTSLEVLSNLEMCSRTPSHVGRTNKANKTSQERKNLTSSTSLDADNSSSEISSLGEVKLNLKKKLRRDRAQTSSESSTSSNYSLFSSKVNSFSILPLRSEGELSSNLTRSRNRSNLPSKSEGEMSYGK